MQERFGGTPSSPVRVRAQVAASGSVVHREEQIPVTESLQPMSPVAVAQRLESPVPPVFIVNAALRLRRFFLRMADAVVPSYMSVYDRFMGAAHTMLVHSAARLRIADLLTAGPLHGAEIAARAGCDADVMERTMLALVSIGIFRRLSDGRFANNRTSKGLISGATGGVRGFAEFFGHEPVMRAWARLPQTLQDGKQGFKEVHGRLAWDWMADDTAVQAAFAEGMSSMTEVVAPAIAAAYPFNEVKTVCDVGGGVGIVLAAVLRKYPHLRGILFDSESMLREASAYLRAAGIADRVDLVPGSFFDSVPRGADCYLIKTVLHNWEDAEVFKILRNCRAAMEPGQRLLVPDFLVMPDAFSTLVPFMDMAGLMIYCGRERSPERLAEMFTDTGLRMGRMVPLPGVQAVFEAVAV